ncbi:hypothetical protein N7457_008755 [Penicillium paradoxum]|uniref:uncharacterized protein n=1 Tax=Penicillium paradoxum TaxID=176176 RepID=UPI002547D44E|nr:uncharacterized protein N7457_008755 [Penicillium paradoxum]KAJ5773859.1 hypothetical protein N7457_008755 [Penicillium paradoxum]
MASDTDARIEESQDIWVDGLRQLSHTSQRRIISEANGNLQGYAEANRAMTSSTRPNDETGTGQIPRVRIAPTVDFSNDPDIVIITPFLQLIDSLQESAAAPDLYWFVGGLRAYQENLERLCPSRTQIVLLEVFQAWQSITPYLEDDGELDSGEGLMRIMATFHGEPMHEEKQGIFQLGCCEDGPQRKRPRI